MASATKAYKAKKLTKSKKMGRKRKKLQAQKGTTPSQEQFFGTNQDS